MFSPRQILKRNLDTFYDYRTGHRKSQKLRIAVEMAFSLLLAGLFQEGIQAFVGTVTAVQAIVLGFAFNVMFFLMSDVPSGGVEPQSLEAKLRAQRVGRLKQELFYNIGYFLLVGMISLGLAFLLLMPSGWTVIYKITHGSIDSNVLLTINLAQNTAFVLVLIGFYFFTIESGASFVRVVGRVNFLFERKREALES